MLRILDKLLLFAMCSCLIFQLEGDYRRVVIFIIGLIVAALTLYIENRKVIGALLIAMAVLCLIEPGFTFLLPLVFFDSFWFSLWWGMGFAVLFFYALPVYQPWMTAIWLFLSLAAVLLAYCTRQATELKRNLIRLRDTSTELSFVMREKNRKLLEEQDTEIYMATLKERNRIAREIHDNVGHMLSRAILQMGALSTVYEEEPLHGQLLKVNDTLNLAMNNIRESVHDLHDDSVDLKQALLEATREMKQHYHLELEYDMSQNVPRKVKYCFIAAVKEAMSNIVKYSNGDRIEIITSQNSHGPSRDWLNIVKSTQAKNKINQWFKQELKEDNIIKGKEMVANYCKTKGIVLSDITKPEYVEKCLNKYGFKDWDSILAAVGHGALKESQIVNRLNEEHLKTKKAEVTDKDVLEEIVAAESKEKSKKKEGKGGIVVKGIHDVAVRFSKCCNPVPGDEIVGFLTRGRGISIHRTDCVNIINFPANERARLIAVSYTHLTLPTIA